MTVCRTSVGFFALSLMSCVTVQFKKPVASFGASVAEAQRVLGHYFAELNDYERKLYLDQRLFDPALPVSASEGGKPTPLLTPVFAPESVRVRIDSLELLSIYAQRLTDLAVSDAPRQAMQSGKALGQSLASLDQHGAMLAGDGAAKNYAGPLEALVAIIDQMWAEQRRDEALRIGIERGAPAVRQIVDLLEADAVEAVKLLRMTGEHWRLADRVLWYNRHRTALADNLAARRALLKDIEVTARRYEAIIAFNPTSITGAIRDANEALVKLASSPKTARSMDQFEASMELFAARVLAASVSASQSSTQSEPACPAQP